MKLKYNSLKKIGILTLSVAMLTGNFLPTVGHAQVEPVSTETVTVTENTMVDELMDKSLEIENYIQLSSNGNLTLDRGASRILNTAEVQALQNSINLLNQAKDRGEISFTADRSFEINQQGNPIKGERGLTWTSYSFSMSKSTADKLVKTLKKSSDNWTLASILLGGISASVPNPTTIAAASAAALMAYGTSKAANLLSGKISSKGSTVKIQWLPVPKITASKR